MFRTTKLAVVAAAALAVCSVSAGAQSYSEGFKFLKAVKERAGNTVEGILAGSGARLVNTKDMTSGESALHIVARDRDLTWLRFLLSKGARADIQNKDGDTPLIIATQLGWEEGAAALIGAGAKVDAFNSRGETPLILAVHKRNIPMIRQLLSRGADPKRADRIAGYSALDYAKRDDRSGAIVRLLESAQPAKPVAGPSR
ncbi:MAG TPA: ankyrin repeat domain-containing protein [Allosphingosinicella sp.]